MDISRDSASRETGHTSCTDGRTKAIESRPLSGEVRVPVTDIRTFKACSQTHWQAAWTEPSLPDTRVGLKMFFLMES